MLKSDSNDGHGSDLKQAFLRHLPERIGAIEENWGSLIRDEWNKAKLTRLFQRIQDLAGSAGKFGLIQVSESVFSLELYFKTFLKDGDNGGRPKPEQINEINGLIKTLKAVVDDTRAPGTEDILRSQEKRPDIFFLRFSDDIAPGLSTALEAMQCKVSRFKRVDDLLKAIDKNPPAALVVDAQLLPGLHPLTDRLTQVKKEQGVAPPLTFVSASNKLDIRLNAMRAGAEAFFVTPIDASTVAARIKQLASPKTDRTFRIMIVDDDPSQADFAAAILRKADMEICTVTEPLQVLNTLDAFRPDLILMDLYMPEADGMELTSIIREQNEFIGMPIVFVSGEQDTDKQLDALSVGGDDFIAKPIRPRHLISTIKNRVQRARALQGQTKVQSHRDPVTGLFNRRHFFERLDNMVASNSPHAGATCLLIAELDRREEIQQRIGIGQTDALLAELGSLIATQIEPQDIAARIDENRFALLARRPLDRNLSELVDNLLQTVADHDFAEHSSDTGATLSAGLCFFDAAPDDAAGLVNRAGKACQAAQAAGGNRLEIHRPSTFGQTDTPSAPQDPVELVRAALEDNTFQVLFQPFVDLHNRESENYQMSLRLRTDEGDQLTDAEFMPAAKVANLSRTVDQWTARRALDVLQERRRSGSEVRLLIAQTAATLKDKDSMEWLRHELRSRQLVGSGLILEFNLVDAAGNLRHSRELLKELNDMGIEVCLARFGHNDASYKVLQFLGANYIKVVDKLLEANSTVISQMVQRAHELRAQVIIPRVDDTRLIGQQWLSGADFVQGNAIQHPQERPDYDFNEQLE